MAKQARKKQRVINVILGVNKYNIKKSLPLAVRISEAKQNVTLRGTIADAMAGLPGQSFGCHLSDTAVRNRKLFPHDVVLAAFYKSQAIIIDEIYSGGRRAQAQAHGWLYEHSAGQWVDLNDEDKDKNFVKEHPELEGKEFTLRVPRKRVPNGGGGGNRTALQPKRGSKEGFKLARGAMRRAEKAGLIDSGLRKVMIDDLADAE
jgi:hypothetical protein